MKSETPIQLNVEKPSDDIPLIRNFTFKNRKNSPQKHLSQVSYSSSEDEDLYKTSSSTPGPIKENNTASKIIQQPTKLKPTPQDKPPPL